MFTLVLLLFRNLFKSTTKNLSCTLWKRKRKANFESNLIQTLRRFYLSYPVNSSNNCKFGSKGWLPFLSRVEVLKHCLKKPNRRLLWKHTLYFCSQVFCTFQIFKNIETSLWNWKYELRLWNCLGWEKFSSEGQFMYWGRLVFDGNWN